MDTVTQVEQVSRVLQVIVEDEWEYLYDEAKVARKEAEIARKREEQG